MSRGEELMGVRIVGVVPVGVTAAGVVLVGVRTTGVLLREAQERACGSRPPEDVIMSERADMRDGECTLEPRLAGAAVGLVTGGAAGSRGVLMEVRGREVGGLRSG